MGKSPTSASIGARSDRQINALLSPKRLTYTQSASIMGVRSSQAATTILTAAGQLSNYFI